MAKPNRSSTSVLYFAEFSTDGKNWYRVIAPLSWYVATGTRYDFSHEQAVILIQWDKERTNEENLPVGAKVIGGNRKYRIAKCELACTVEEVE